MASVVMCFASSLTTQAQPSYLGPPLIGKPIQRPEKPPPRVPVRVFVEIKTDALLESTSLIYTVNSISTSLTMKIILGDKKIGQYMAIIPGQELGLTVSYIIYARDSLGLESQSITYAFIVTADQIGPAIELGAPYVPPNWIHPITEWDEPRLRCRVTDEGSGVKNATINYDAGKIRKGSVVMNRVSGDEYDGQWECVLPTFPNGTTIRYSAVAYDFAQNLGSSKEPYREYEIFTNPERKFSMNLWVENLTLHENKTATASVRMYFSGVVVSEYCPPYLPIWFQILSDPSGIPSFAHYSVVQPAKDNRFWFSRSESFDVFIMQIRGTEYPADAYSFNMKIQIYPTQFDKSRSFFGVYFGRQVEDEWEIIQTQEPVLSNEETSAVISFRYEFHRRLLVTSPVMFPIYAMVWIMGASLLMDFRETDGLDNRIRLYSGPFIFNAGFYYSVIKLLPTTSRLPQRLMVNLSLSLCALLILSVFGSRLHKFSRWLSNPEGELLYNLSSAMFAYGLAVLLNETWDLLLGAPYIRDVILVGMLLGVLFQTISHPTVRSINLRRQMQRLTKRMINYLRRRQ